MSFRSRFVNAGCVLTLLMFCSAILTGCCSSQGGRGQASNWAFWKPRKPVRRATVRPSEPVQANPDDAYPGALPSPDPQFEVRPPVQTAPEPIDLPPSPEAPGQGPSTEDADPMSVPLPAPPRLPTRAKTSQPRPLPPLPEMPDFSDASPTFPGSEQLPAVPNMEREPGSSSDSGFSRAPGQFRVPAPRVAQRSDRFERSRQPVRLEVPEVELNAEPINTDSINADIFEDEPRVRAFRSADEALPTLDDDQENLDLAPVPPPPTLESEIETQSLHIDPARNGVNGRLRHADVKNDGLPPHSAQLPRKKQGLRCHNLQLARNTRVGPESAIDTQGLYAGQKVLIEGELTGLQAVNVRGALQTKISYHLELLTPKEKVVFQTESQAATELVQASAGTRKFSRWLTVPAQLQPGAYRLRLLVQDEAAGNSTVSEVPVCVM